MLGYEEKNWSVVELGTFCGHNTVLRMKPQTMWTEYKTKRGRSIEYDEEQRIISYIYLRQLGHHCTIN